MNMDAKKAKVNLVDTDILEVFLERITNNSLILEIN